MKKIIVFLTVIALLVIIFFIANSIEIPAPSKLNTHNLSIDEFI